VIAYKLIKKRKNGTYGPLFFDARLNIPFGVWLDAKDMGPKKGYARRPGWHCCFTPCAPHLSNKGRVWAEVEIEDHSTYKRPKCQGGAWLLAKRIKFNRIMFGEAP